MWSWLALASAAPPREQLRVPADDGHALALWAEVPEDPRGAVVLLHGRTWSSVPDFDLEVPGGAPSTMDALAAEGFAVYALDLRGYGATDRDGSGWNTPDRAARDLASAAAFVARRHPDLRPPVVLGWSLGALVAHLFAQRHPEALSVLVLYGYPRDVRKPVSSDDGPPADAPPPRRANTAEAAASDFVTPVDRATVDAYVAAALGADPVRADWRAWRQLSELDAARLTVPTLVLHGAADPTTSFAMQAHLFEDLGTRDRTWTELAGGDHAAHLEPAAPAFVHAIVSFVDLPRAPLPAAPAASR